MERGYGKSELGKEKNPSVVGRWETSRARGSLGDRVKSGKEDMGTSCEGRLGYNVLASRAKPNNTAIGELVEDGEYPLVPLGHGCGGRRSHGHVRGATAATAAVGDGGYCSCDGHLGIKQMQ